MKNSPEHKILIFETDLDRRNRLRSIISEWGYVIFCFEKETTCFDNISALHPDLVISGQLPLERSFRFINAIKMINYHLPVLMISVDRSFEDLIGSSGFSNLNVIKWGFEPLELKEAISTILQERLNNEHRREYPIIVGNTPEMVKIKKMIPELRRSKEPLLLMGESGTGKELVAKAIHWQSNRENNPFIKVSSSAFAGSHLEKVLSNYHFVMENEPQKNKKENLEIADVGTIFLDEITNIPASLQGELFRIFEEGGIFTIDSRSNHPIRVRVIASTSEDLEMLVEKGKFRKDLYYRLNVFIIGIPPLRNRMADIPLITDFFTDKFCTAFGKSHYELSSDTKSVFFDYHWPGNVRELENLVKSIVVLGEEENILDNLCGKNKKCESGVLAKCSENIYDLAELKDIKKFLGNLDNLSLKDLCNEFMGRAEKKLMRLALESTNWNRKKAAKILNISYKSLLNKINEYNLP